MAPISTESKYAGLLATSETGLGSLLHGYHVPFAGHWLSLIQAFFLSRYIDELDPSEPCRPHRMSTLAASVKSLSPMGKRLTPMLAISAQGLLFSLGVTIAGRNRIGAAIGSAILSLWAFIQPVLTLYLVMGEKLVVISNYYLSELQKIFQFDARNLLVIVAAVVTLKILVSAGLAAAAFSKNKMKIETRILEFNKATQPKLSKAEGRQSDLSTTRRILLDLCQPWFLISLGLSLVFFYLTEPSWVQMAWGVLRIIAAAALVFYLRRGLFRNALFLNS